MRREPSGREVPRVEWGDTLRLHFRLTAANGEVVDSTFDEMPANVTLGSGELEPNLESLLIGLSLGERRIFLLEPWAAFGEPVPDKIERLPLSDFSLDTPPVPDALIEFSLPNGTTLPGRILAVDEGTVTVDFNHPLAGVPVSFEVEILGIE